MGERKGAGNTGGGGQRAPRPRGRVGRLRWAFRAALCLFGVAALGLFVVTRPPVLRAIVAPRLGAMLGCDSSCDRVTLLTNGQIVLEGATLRAPSVPGAGGEFLFAPRIAVDIDWGSAVGALLGGGPTRVRSVTLSHPMVRLSQSIDDGSFNVTPLLTRGGTIAASGSLPELRVIDGALTFGEHTGNEYTQLVGMRVEGSLRVSGADAAVYDVSLDQLDPAPGAAPMRMGGTVDLRAGAVALRMSNLDLARWGEAAPLARAGDLWRQMAIDGRIADATFRYAAATGVAADLRLEQVNLTVPVPSEPDPRVGPVYPLMRMRAVDGVIALDSAGLHADLRGIVEDLPGRLVLDTRGFSLDAPLRCEITTERSVVSERPDLLPFAPEDVRTLFRDFSGPTAEVTGTVLLTRGDPVNGHAAPLRTRGSITFENGRAAHAEFPYSISQIRGAVSFDDDRVDIVRITGVGATGAKLLAEGWFGLRVGDPVEIDVTLADVPIDDELIGAMPPSDRAIVDAVCNRPAYDALRAAGLVQSSEDAGATAAALDADRARVEALRASGGSASARVALEREIEELERRAALPVFDLGGVGDVHVSVRREKGGEYNRRVDVRFPSLGLLPEEFPYPMVAGDVRLTILAGSVEASAAALRGLSGGTGALTATIQLATPESPIAHPDVRLTAVDAPIDALLLHAFPDRSPDRAGGPGLRRMLGALGLSGRFDAAARVFKRPDGSPTIDAHVTLKDVAAAPAAPGAEGEATPAAVLTGLSGDIAITPDAVVVGPLGGSLGAGGRLALSCSVQFGNDRSTGGAVRADVDAHGLDLALPIERVIGAFSPDLAARAAALRATSRPEGVLDARAQIGVTPQGSLDGDLTVTAVDHASFDALGGRLALSNLEGETTLTLRSAELRNVASDVAFDGAPLGRVDADGRIGLSKGSPTDATVHIARGAFESALCRSLVALAVSPDAASTVGRLSPRGVFEARAHVVSGEGGRFVADGWIEPRSLTVTTSGGEIAMGAMSGRVTFGPDGGDVLDLRADDGETSVRADGRWFTGPGAGVELAVSGEMARLTPSVLAALPADVRDALRSINLNLAGGLTLDESNLVIRRDAARFAGSMGFAQVSLHAGAPLDELSGRATLAVEHDPGKDTTVDLTITADTLRFARVPLTDGRATLRSGARPGDFEITSFVANTFGGRLAASGMVHAASVGGGAMTPRASSYEADIALIGVDLAAAMGERSVNDAQSADGGRGRLDAQLSLAGVIDDPGSTRGRGHVRARGGRIVRLPLLLPVLELSNLQPPMGEDIALAEAEFYVQGRRAVFDSLVATSSSLAVVGEGSATWPDLELDLRFRTSGTLRVPFLSDLVDAVRNELLAIRVRGTLSDPSFGAEQMPTTSRMFKEVFQTTPTKRPTPERPERTADGGPRE